MRVKFGRRGIMAMIAGCCLSPAWAQRGVPPTSVMIGGQPMASDHDLMDNLSQSSQHTVLLSLLQAAGMFDALRAHGPFTLFAPTNAAFAELPPGELETMRRPENKDRLIGLLSMQILPGDFSSARLHYLLRAGKGSAELSTVSDGKVTVLANGPPNLVIRDPGGGIASITLYDAKAANGVMFVTDRVLQPG